MSVTFYVSEDLRPYLQLVCEPVKPEVRSDLCLEHFPMAHRACYKCIAQELEETLMIVRRDIAEDR